MVGGKKNHTVLVLAVNPKFTISRVLAWFYQVTFDSHSFENQSKVLPSRLLGVFEDDAIRAIDICVEEHMADTVRIADDVKQLRVVDFHSQRHLGDSIR